MVFHVIPCSAEHREGEDVLPAGSLLGVHVVAVPYYFSSEFYNCSSVYALCVLYNVHRTHARGTYGKNRKFYDSIIAVQVKEKKLKINIQYSEKKVHERKVLAPFHKFVAKME
jgi:hypothetical protein